ncbi:cyanophycinase [Pontibacter ramchanderi]|uniref:Cyanophycinase n=1 Tax=Pontibacter ramchanderi TaxID=1179743 RepID=A0A2N3U7Y3_9BACT|nr:cyanophycinase [Pontibacter ramchanderi]PKV62844.1 cyanophycinase [Pontibacter ramchanderi]
MAKKKESDHGNPVTEQTAMQEQKDLVLEKLEMKKRAHGKALPVPKGKLLAIGGKESKSTDKETETQENNIDFIAEQILQRFVDELKGSNPLILVVPTASTEPEEAAKDYVKLFRQLEQKNIEVLNIKVRTDAFDAENLKLVERAAGIIFTGGDQLRLTAILGGTPLLQLMKQRYTYDDIIIAGTSAGATALSTPMIYEGETQGGMLKGDVRITTGLEFLKNVAIDTHFIARGRIVRMAQAIATNPGCIGIGIEEDTAILVTDGNRVEVVGSGLVTVVDGTGISKSTIHEIKTGQPFTVCDLKVHLAADTETFDIPFYEMLHI